MIAGHSGWLVPARSAQALGDALGEALRNRATLEARGQRGRELASERFDLRTIIAQTHASYTELLGGAAA